MCTLICDLHCPQKPYASSFISKELSIYAPNQSKEWSLPCEEIFDFTKLKEFAVDKVNVTHTLGFVFGVVVNHVGKGENTGYQHFLFRKKCFVKSLKPQGHFEIYICRVKG